jgi:hypothetical protein
MRENQLHVLLLHTIALLLPRHAIGITYDRLADLLLGKGKRPYAGFVAPADMHADMWYQGSFQHHRDLADELVRNAGTAGWVVEFGSFMGSSALAWARAVNRQNKSTKVVCVDTWLGEHNFWRMKGKQLGPQAADGTPRIFEMFMLNTRNHSDRLIPLRMNADSGLRYLTELVVKKGLQQPGAVYVDTAHTYPETVLELRAAYDLLAPGGFLVGDDFRGDWARVQQSVNEFVEWAGRGAFEPPAAYARSWRWRISRVVRVLNGSTPTMDLDEAPLLIRVPGQWVLRKALGGAPPSAEELAERRRWTRNNLKPLHCCLNGWADHRGASITPGARMYKRCAPAAPWLGQRNCRRPNNPLQCNKELLHDFSCRAPRDVARSRIAS